MTQVESVLQYFPDHNAKQCDSKPMTEFGVGESRFVTLDECCRSQFPNTLANCCESDGLEGCVLSGVATYIPDWVNVKCALRDQSLLAVWEEKWSSANIETCCDRCKLEKLERIIAFPRPSL